MDIPSPDNLWKGKYDQGFDSNIRIAGDDCRDIVHHALHRVEAVIRHICAVILHNPQTVTTNVGYKHSTILR